MNKLTQQLEREWVELRKLREAEQPAQRKPLTDQQIEQIFKENAGYSGNDFISFARAIEAAHGIKENT